MCSRSRVFAVAGLVLGLGIGSIGAQAAEVSAEESTVMAAPTVAPTITPVHVPGPAASPIAGIHKAQPTQLCAKVKELELNWNVAIGMGNYSENSQENSLSGMGAMLEINPGIKVTTAPGLDLGMVAGFLLLSSDGSFSVPNAGPPASTRNWQVTAMSTGAYLLAKYSYDFDLDVIKIGLENGLGLGYFISSVDTEWVDASNGSITGGNSEEERSWLPVVKAGLKVAMPVTEVSSLGLNLGANVIPLSAGDYTNFVTISAGLNYQVQF